MTRILGLTVAAIALVAMAGTAHAGTGKRHGKKHMQQSQYYSQHQKQEGYWSSYGYSGDRYDYSQRRDPSTWTGPLNAWDKARRDDSLLGRW
jgi:hypothetical protein